MGARSPVFNEKQKWDGEFRSSDSNKPNIKINDIHIDSTSHIFDPDKDYVGLMVYLCDDKDDFKLGGVRCKTGDIYIKQVDSLLNSVPRIKNKKGKSLHGRLFHSIFGCWKTKKLNFVGAGFSYHDGDLVFNSGTLNTMNPENNDDTYHNTSRGLQKYEKQLIKKVWIHLYENHRWLELLPDTRVNWRNLPELEKPPCVNLAQVHANRKLNGTVVRFNENRGFGFIKFIGYNRDIFVHFSNILHRPYGSQYLEVDQNVEFQIKHTQRGWQAINVSIVNPK